MANVTYGGKVRLILLSLSIFFILISCSSKNQQQWQIDRTVVSNKDYNSGKLSLPAINPFCGLELELVRGSSGTRMYLNAFSLPYPSNLDDPTKTEVMLSIDQQVYVIMADRFQGGQRLLLPADAASLIITALRNDNLVDITVGRYSARIISTRFAELYAQLNKIPS